MGNYQLRLDRIEEMLATPESAPFFVWRDVGETCEQAAAKYAKDHGLDDAAILRILDRGIFVSWKGRHRS